MIDYLHTGIGSCICEICGFFSLHLLTLKSSFKQKVLQNDSVGKKLSVHFAILTVQVSQSKMNSER